MTDRVLVTWHSEAHGVGVLEAALRRFAARRLPIDRVLYLLQDGRTRSVPETVADVPVEVLRFSIADPTQHAALYELVSERVVPRLRGEVHVNVSPGTPAMHAVWLVLHAGGAFPPETRLWSSQFDRATGRTRLDPVEFPLSTYLATIRRARQVAPALAAYDPEARSPARRAALERLARYARVRGAPLLVLGERGTGKTRAVETLVSAFKGREKIVTVPCGGLDSTLIESVLFGHRKGAFTGAAADREGLLAQANGGILFLDEVQDLPSAAQRKLVRVLQDRRRRFRPVGSDTEISVDVEIVCASNLPLAELRARLDDDLYDRVSHLTVTMPPLRECRDDAHDDWRAVWRELRLDDTLPEEAPWNDELAAALAAHSLPGNLRDLQRLVLLAASWWQGADAQAAVGRALREWLAHVEAAPPDEEFGTGTRDQRVMWFRARLARWARGQYGTWRAAAVALGCDEKTLRADGRST